MSRLTIPTHLLERLQRIAEREGRSVEAALTTLLAGYPDEPPLNDDDPAAPPLGTLARMAYEAQRAGIATGNPDLVDQSRRNRERSQWVPNDG